MINIQKLIEDANENASYSEFVRRTALIEAAKIIKKNENEGAKADECN